MERDDAKPSLLVKRERAADLIEITNHALDPVVLQKTGLLWAGPTEEPCQDARSQNGMALTLLLGPLSARKTHVLVGGVASPLSMSEWALFLLSQRSIPFPTGVPLQRSSRTDPGLCRIALAILEQTGEHRPGHCLTFP
jgi:hypothetical protein